LRADAQAWTHTQKRAKGLLALAGGAQGPKTGFYPAKTIEKHGNINDFGLRPARPAQAAI
jgi:hypothetical protein